MAEANVVCRACGGRYHEITDRFDPHRPPHGAMFRLKEQYRANGWGSFPEHDGIIDAGLVCPECDTPYCQHGRVRLDRSWLEIQRGEAEQAFAEYEPELPAPREEDDLNAQVLHLHDQGLKPSEIAKRLGLGHHMAVMNRLRAMGRA